MKFNELHNIPQWSKNFWNPFVSPVLHAPYMYPRALYDNFHNGIKSYDHKWHDFDTEERYYKNCKKLNPIYHNKDINYTFNAHGYRSESFDADSDLKILTLGCSIAFGTGVDDKDVWCNNISNNAKVYNISIPGASADLNAMTFYQLIDIIKPNIVLWLPPGMHRRSVNKYFLSEMEPTACHYNETRRGKIILSELQHNHQKVLPSREQYMPYYHQVVSNCENYNNLIKNYAIMNEICENNNILFRSFHSAFVLLDIYHLYKFRLSSREENTRLLFKTILNTEELSIELLEGTESALSVMPTTFIALFDRLDNVVNYTDIRDYTLEFFENQTKEDIDTDIKYPFARDFEHPSELYHQFLAHVSRRILLKEGVKL